MKATGGVVVAVVRGDGAVPVWADDAVRKLREAGAEWVVIAGKPRGPLSDAVDDSAAMGVDALNFLHRTREKLA